MHVAGRQEGLDLRPPSADMDLVHLKRWYLVALGVALVALAAARVAGVGSSSGKPLSAGQMRALEIAALERLKFPSTFVRTDSGCMTGRCYVVAAPASQVTSLVPGIMRAHGMQPPGSLRSAEPVAALRLAGARQEQRDLRCREAEMRPGRFRKPRDPGAPRGRSPSRRSWPTPP